MATIAKQVINRTTGLNPVFVAADVGGDDFVNDGKQFVHIKNGDVDAMNVTITTNAIDCGDGLVLADVVINIPASEERMIGGFPFEIYNDTAAEGGKVRLAYDDNTLVTLAVFEYTKEEFAPTP